MKKMRNWVFLVTAVVFLGLGTVTRSGIAQDKKNDSSSSPDVLSQLESCVKNSFDSSSFTVDRKQSTKIKMTGGANRTQDITGTIKKKNEFLFIDQRMNTAPGGTGKGPIEMAIKIIGTAGDSPSGFIHSEQFGGWKKLSKFPMFDMKRLDKSLEQPRKFLEMIQKITSREEEKANGIDCLKVSVSLDKEKLKKYLMNRLKEEMNIAPGNMDVKPNVSVKNTNLSYWIHRKENKLVRVQSKLQVTVNMKGTSSGGAIDTNFDQTIHQTLDYRDYDTTRIPEKYMKKFKELSGEKQDEKKKGEKEKEEKEKKEKGQPSKNGKED